MVGWQFWIKENLSGIQITLIALPAQTFAQWVGGARGCRSRQMSIYLETPKRTSCCSWLSFSLELWALWGTKSVKLEGKHSVAKLAAGNHFCEEMGYPGEASRPWHHPLHEFGEHRRDPECSLGVWNNSSSYQIISNLHKPFHVGSRAKAWSNGIAA